MVQADIAQFYGSLYTHSIPWALHGKAASKANRGPELIGNVFDELARNMQDGQTIGLPIGPDTSLVIAEVVLASVDLELATVVAADGACRLIDDYEIRAGDRTEAERVLGTLQRALGSVELALNPKKTQIRELPSPFAGHWVHEIRRFHFRKSPMSQRFDLLAFYDLAFRTASEHPDGAVLKYAVSRLRPIRVHPDNWQMHERFLHQAMLAEPGLSAECLSQLLRFQALGMPVDLAGLSDVVTQHIVVHCPQWHGNDVAWAIWIALAFGFPLSATAVDAAENMEDAVVALLLLDAESQGLLPRAISKTAWDQFMATAELYGEQWLLSYEARLKEWRPSRGGGDHIADDPNFDWMKSHGVSFYEPISRPVRPPVAHVDRLMELENFGFSAA